MISGWTIRKRVAVFVLIIINVWLIFTNINYMPLSKSGRKYSEYFSSLNPLKISPRSRPNTGHEKSIRHHNVTDQKKPLVWRLVKNSDSVLPIYKKLHKILANLESDKPTLMKEFSAFKVDSKVRRFKSAANIGDTSRLEDKLRDALYTGRRLKIGIVGASNTLAESVCFNNSVCTHYNILQNWLEAILGTTVDVQVAAIDLSNSEYYAFCIKAHLDLDSMDIVLWELAVEDYFLHTNYVRDEYSDPGRPQEELTRQILKSPKQPYLIYVNFIQMQEVLNQKCFNSESYAGRYLSIHYNVTSISWQFSFCTLLYSGYFQLSDYISKGDRNQPSLIVYGQMGLLLIHHFGTYLQKILKEDIEGTGRLSKNVKRMMANHDQYLKDYEAVLDGKRQEEQHRALENYDLMLEDTLAEELNSTLKLAKKNGREKTEPVESQLIEPLYEGETWINSPQCLTASKPVTSRNYQLEAVSNRGWVLTSRPRANWWVSSRQEESVTFPVVVEKLEGYDAVVAITKIICQQCGQAVAWIDDQFHQSVLMDSQGQPEGFFVQEVAIKVGPGKHSVSIKNMQDKHFKISAVMVAYKESESGDSVRKQFLKFNRKFFNQ